MKHTLMALLALGLCVPLGCGKKPAVEKQDAFILRVGEAVLVEMLCRDCADLLDCVFSPIKVVRTAGLEPATFSSGNYCSIQLSYARKLRLGYANETRSATLVFRLLAVLFLLVLRGKNSDASKK